MRTLPFFGRGLAWQPRINPATGGFVVSEGYEEAGTVGLDYISQQWSIRESLPGVPPNHIAESIANILLTRIGEHDTLPAFGSKLAEAVFEPNTIEFQKVFALYLETSTIRWEKRAYIPKSGVSWLGTPYLTDQGELPVGVNIQFIANQVQGNLVAPFVTPRQARSQEYPPVQFDSLGHDFYSRYFNRQTIEDGEITAIRFKASSPLPPQNDDIFYKVRHKDTWLMISWNLYGDIRYWNIIAELWVQDQAANGASRSTMNITDVPPYGTALRLPSKARLLSQLSTYEP